MTEEADRLPDGGGAEGVSPGKVLRRLLVFILLAAAGVAASHFAPHGGKLDMAALDALAARLGAWGPVIVLAAGLLTPLAFLPRWPIAYVCGLLYGIGWGTLLATVASLLGATLHFVLARSLLAPVSQRVMRKFRMDRRTIPPQREFMAVFLLRAFPLSNFVATNLLCGALRIRPRVYVAASFLGMIPSSLMYAAWGKLLKKPSGEFYGIAALTLVLIVVGAVWGGRLLRQWRAQAGPGAGTPPETGASG